jgi:hypothetical protein
MNILKNNGEILSHLKSYKIFKDEYDKKFALFVLVHVIVWTLIPTLLHVVIRYHSVENFAFGQEFEWGYFKHPPFSSWIIGLWFKIFPTNNFFFFLLFQVNIGIGFLYIYKLANELFEKPKAYIAIILLELILFYSFRYPLHADAIQHDTIQLSLWPIGIYYFYKVLFLNSKKYWPHTWMITAIILLSKYFGIVLLLSIFSFVFFSNKLKKYLIFMFFSLIFVSIILFPHIIWLFQNDFLSLKYASNRHHDQYFFTALFFILTQLLIFLPLFWIGKKILKIKNKKYTQSDLFVIFVFILPFTITIILGIITNSEIKFRFATPFWGCIGILIMSYATVYGKREERIIEKIVYGFMGLFLLGTISVKGYRIITNTDPYPYEQKIAEHITKEWHEAYKLPLRYTSDCFLSFYSSDTPSTFLGLDYKINTWIKKENLIKDGIVVLGSPPENLFSWTKGDARKTTINDREYTYTFIPPQTSEKGELKNEKE